MGEVESGAGWDRIAILLRRNQISFDQTNEEMASMNEKDFNNLVESIKEAGQIQAGKLPPSRRFEFSPLDIKAIREKLKK